MCNSNKSKSIGITCTGISEKSATNPMNEKFVLQ